MSIIHSTAPPLIPPPDNLIIPQFFLDLPGSVTRGQTPCLVDEESGKEVGVDELRARSHGLANALRLRWKLLDSDNVCIFSFNHIDYPVCVWSVHMLGGVVAPTSPSLTVEELLFQLQITKPKVIIAHVDALSVAMEAASAVNLPRESIIVIDAHKSPTPLRQVSLEDAITYGSSHPRSFEMPVLKAGEGKKKAAFLCFSSGTTGKPKAVVISHYNVICNVCQVATSHRLTEHSSPDEDRRFRPGDVCSGVLPLYHIYGLVVNLHYILYAGMTLVVAQKFNFEKMLKSISRYRITHLMIVPPQVVLFCKHPAVKTHDLRTVRCCMVAAAPLSAELTQQLLSVMPNIHLGQGYGMTETCAAVSMFPLSQRVGTLGSGGQLVSGTIAKVIRADGSLAVIGEEGELYVKGGQIALGYYKNDEATKETFVDGWVRTGDKVIVHANGDIFIVDRIKEILKVNGYQVAPAELEGHLLTHPDVVDAAVVGVPHEFSGEVPRAFVVLRPEVARVAAGSRIATGHIEKSIQKHVSDAKSRYKWLDGGVEFIDGIPKNASGKILRRVLRDHVNHRSTLPASRL